MADLTKGDVVALKIVTRMTVNDIRSDGMVECKWFTGDELHTGLFQSGALEPAPPVAK